MRSRFDPTKAYLETEEKAKFNCQPNRILSINENIQNCGNYSMMTNQLKSIAKTHKKNEEFLKKNTPLEIEAYDDCIRFQDHTMMKTVCSWADSFFETNHKLRNKQLKLEKEAEMIFYNQPTVLNK
ncbi:MAG: hypothetical protein H0T84_03190 [Tatlockia sp.]|nr:hypothetical protein [Tatlockia sp.]